MLFQYKLRQTSLIAPVLRSLVYLKPSVPSFSRALKPFKTTKYRPKSSKNQNKLAENFENLSLTDRGL